MNLKIWKLVILNYINQFLVNMNEYCIKKKPSAQMSIYYL